MRALALIVPAILLGACQVTEDDANDQVTIGYNADVAEQAAADVGNAAKVAANEVGAAARDVTNEVRNVDVDVDVKTDGNAANANAN